MEYSKKAILINLTMFVITLVVFIILVMYEYSNILFIFTLLVSINFLSITYIDRKLITERKKYLEKFHQKKEVDNHMKVYKNVYIKFELYIGIVFLVLSEICLRYNESSFKRYLVVLLKPDTIFGFIITISGCSINEFSEQLCSKLPKAFCTSRKRRIIKFLGLIIMISGLTVLWIV